MTLSTPVLPASRRAPRQLQGFAELAAAAASLDEPVWLRELRQRGASIALTDGLPTSRDEEWRFTSLQGMTERAFRQRRTPAAVDAAAITTVAGGFGEGPLLVFVDGVFDRGVSRTPPATGIVISTVASELAAGNPLVAAQVGQHIKADASPFAAINAALFADGAFVHVTAGVRSAAPIRILHVSTVGAADTIVAPRTLIVIDREADASIVELWAATEGAGSYLMSACTEVVLGAGARLAHARVQRESTSAWHVGFTAVSQQRDSHYRAFTLDLGGRLSRHNLQARLEQPNIETLLYGLYLGRGEQLLDNHTAIYHDQPNCNSWEVYKGVLTDQAHAVFNGKVLVASIAQKTDAKQTNRNLLLSDRAKVDTKPQLEIFADDVKCTHGATVGRLDEQQRYYLRTRGIAGREAEQLLIAAFVSEVTAEIADDRIRSAVTALVDAQLTAMIG